MATPGQQQCVETFSVGPMPHKRHGGPSEAGSDSPEKPVPFPGGTKMGGYVGNGFRCP